jgi:foldase protein PrsA
MSHVAMSASAAEPAQPAIEAVAEDPVVMTIDGAPVTVGEFKLVMEGHLSNVAGHFHALGIDDHHGYWKEKESGDSPILMLRKVVTEDLARIKTIQSWAKEKGLIADISFAAYQRHLVEENARRQKAVDSGQVIYGPRQYKAYRYYFFRLRDLEQAILEKLVKEPSYAVADADIETFYNENKDSFGGRNLEDSRAQIAGIFQKKKYAAELKDRIASAKVKVDEAVLKTIAPRHDT